MSTPSIGFTGKGGVVSLSTDGTTFTPVDQITKYAPSAAKAAFADITNLSSPDAFIERIPTTLDSGTVSITCVSNPTDAGQLMLLAAFIAQTKLTVKVQYPPVAAQTTGLVNTYSAYVSSAPMPGLAVTEASTIDAEFTITGKVAATPGS